MGTDTSYEFRCAADDQEGLNLQAEQFTVSGIMAGIHYFRIQDAIEQVALVKMLDHLLRVTPEVLILLRFCSYLYCCSLSGCSNQ